VSIGKVNGVFVRPLRRDTDSHGLRKVWLRRFFYRERQGFLFFSWSTCIPKRSN